jgi:chromosome segregation ATPase
MHLKSWILEKGEKEFDVKRIFKGVFVKVLSLVLVFSFLNLEISWAYTIAEKGVNTLAIQSVFQPEMMTEQAASFKGSILQEAALLTSVFAIGEYLLGSSSREGYSVSAENVEYLETVIKNELPPEAYRGIELEKVVTLSYLRKHRPQELLEIFDRTGIKYSDRSEVVFIPYTDTDNGKRYIIQLSDPRSISARDLGGYQLPSIMDRYVVKVLPEEYGEITDLAIKERRGHISLTKDDIENDLADTESQEDIEDEKAQKKHRRSMPRGLKRFLGILFFVSMVLAPSFSRGQQSDSQKIDEEIKTPAITANEEARIRREAENEKRRIDSLLNDLYSMNPSVAVRAVRALALVDDERVLPTFMDAIPTSPGVVHRAMIAVLADKAERGEEILPLLIEGTKQSNWERRWVTAGAMRNMRIEIGPEAIDALKVLLRDPYSQVRGAAARALSIHKWQPATEEERIVFMVANRQWDNLRSMGKKMIEYIMPFVDSGVRDIEIQFMLPLIAEVDPEGSKEILIKYLHTEYTSTKRYAFIGLGRTKGEETTRIMIQALDDNDYTTVGIGLRSLGNKGDPLAIPRVLKAFREDEIWQVRQEAATALYKLGWRPVEMAETIDFHVARGDWDAVNALGKEALPHIQERLRLSLSEFLSGMSTHFHKFSPETADAIIEVLVERFKGPDIMRRWEAYEILIKLKEHPVAMAHVRPIMEDKVLHDIYELGSSVYGDPNKEGNCKWAAERLGRSGDRRAIGPLKDFLLFKTYDSTAIAIAREALARLIESTARDVEEIDTDSLISPAYDEERDIRLLELLQAEPEKDIVEIDEYIEETKDILPLSEQVIPEKAKQEIEYTRIGRIGEKKALGLILSAFLSGIILTKVLSLYKGRKQKGKTKEGRDDLKMRREDISKTTQIIDERKKELEKLERKKQDEYDQVQQKIEKATEKLVSLRQDAEKAQDGLAKALLARNIMDLEKVLVRMRGEEKEVRRAFEDLERRIAEIKAESVTSSEALETIKSERSREEESLKELKEQRAELDKSVKEAAEELEARRQELDDASRELDATSRELDDKSRALNEKSLELEKKMSELSEAERAAGESITERENRIKEIEERVAALTSEHETMASGIAALEKERALKQQELETASQAHRTGVEEYERISEKNKAELETGRRALEDLERRIGEIKAESVTSSEALETIKSERSREEESLEGLKQQRAELDKSVKEAAEELEARRQELDDASRELDATSRELDDKSRALNEKSLELEKKMSELSEAERAAGESITERENRIKEIEERVAALTSEHETMASGIAALEKERALKQQELETASQAHRTGVEEYERISEKNKAELETGRRALEYLERRIGEIKAESVTSREALETIKSERSREEESLKELKDQRAELDKSVKEAAEELEARRQELDDASRELDDKSRALNEKSLELEKKMSELSEAERASGESIAERENRIKEIEEEIRVLALRKENVSGEITLLEEKIADMTEKISESSATISSLEARELELKGRVENLSSVIVSPTIVSSIIKERSLRDFDGFMKDFFHDIPGEQPTLSGIIEDLVSSKRGVEEKIIYLDLVGDGMMPKELMDRYSGNLEVYTLFSDNKDLEGLTRDSELEFKLDVITHATFVEDIDDLEEIIAFSYNNLKPGGILLAAYAMTPKIHAESASFLQYLNHIAEAMPGVSLRERYIEKEDIYLITISAKKLSEQKIKTDSLPTRPPQGTSAGQYVSAGLIAIGGLYAMSEILKLPFHSGIIPGGSGILSSLGVIFFMIGMIRSSDELPVLTESTSEYLSMTDPLGEYMPEYSKEAEGIELLSVKGRAADVKDIDVKEEKKSTDEKSLKPFFELVETTINNRRTRSVKVANEMVDYLRQEKEEFPGFDLDNIDRKENTAVLIEKMERILVVLDERNRDSKMDLPDNIRENAVYLEGNLDRFETDSVIVSIIIMARKAKRSGTKLVIGIETGWIPGYENGKFQYGAINPLVREIEKLGRVFRSMGLDNVVILHSDGDVLVDEILNETDSDRLSEVVVLASTETIRSSNFDVLRSSKDRIKAFLAEVDPTALREYYDTNRESFERQIAIEFIGMLSITLELAAGNEAPNLPIVAEYDKDLRTVTFLPQPMPMEYEQLIHFYKMKLLSLRSV